MTNPKFLKESQEEVTTWKRDNRNKDFGGRSYLTFACVKCSCRFENEKDRARTNSSVQSAKNCAVKWRFECVLVCAVKWWFECVLESEGYMKKGIQEKHKQWPLQQKCCTHPLLPCICDKASLKNRMEASECTYCIWFVTVN